MRVDAVVLGATLVSSRGSGTEGTTLKGARATTMTHAAPPPRSDNPTAPLSSEAAARAFNLAFNGYDVSLPGTQSGVTLTWLKHEDKKLNLYCGEVMGNDDDGCYDGGSSCRMSTIIYNHKLPIIDGKFYTFSGRKVGVVFNQTLVERYFGKCSFLYDGGSVGRYNQGCGNSASAKAINCDSPYSPYKNVCPSSNKTCTADDPEVNSEEVDKFGGHADFNNRNLFYKGPAYNVTAEQLIHWNGKQMWASQDELRTMVDDRFKDQETADCAPMCWNEVILDERLILMQLWWDPATVVAGFAYLRGDADALSQASMVQDAFKSQWGVAPPLVSVDTRCEVDNPACAPFYAHRPNTPEEVVV